MTALAAKLSNIVMLVSLLTLDSRPVGARGSGFRGLVYRETTVVRVDAGVSVEAKDISERSGTVELPPMIITSRNTVSPFKTMVVDSDNLLRDYLINKVP